MVDLLPRLFADLLKLLPGRRSVDVGRDQQRVVAAGLQPAPELGGGGGLAGSLKTGHEHDRGRLGRDLDLHRSAAPQEGDHLVTHDPQDRLVGAEALQDVLAGRLLADSFEKLLDHAEVHVGFEQGEANLPQRRIHVGFGQSALTTQRPEDAL